ncbi:cupin domain-containing protein [Pseudoalteromonas denitrificans]|uniref:Cupin domain-containing protein n=1 Tax=Pseudoalteromonas denitrificans DSM 6059 TaxID=1123010 RepID=A0A1I1UIE0_9GAMM|nr:cupin domain-containing protein [Pseudoalteromonas denitrificans]SFD68523.1 Cupin domain-containing protein [Pseudoalteromonas denitrificans DSM 6059]
MKQNKINLKDKFVKFNDLWSPRVIAQMNDYQFKLVKVAGDFVWHVHEKTDEVFLVIEGTLDIEFRDSKVTLNSGEMCVVPKGVEHKPSAKSQCKIMIIEPENVINTGNIESKLKAKNNIWL